MSSLEISPEARRSARISISGVFFVLAAVFGTWAPRLPAVKDQLGLTSGQLGLALVALSAALFLSTRVAGPAVDRFGSVRAMQVGLPLLCATLVGLAFADSLFTLTLALAALGLAGGFVDIAMNANAVVVERTYRRPIMSAIHGMWSVGLLVAGLLGTAAAAAGMSTKLQFTVTALVLLAASPLLQRGLLREPAEARAARRRVRTTRIGLRASAGVLLLGLIAFSSFFCEGSAADWSAIYLHDHLGAGSGVAGAAFVAFALGMTVSRLTADRVSARFGPVAVVRGGGALAAVGLGLALVLATPAAALAGFALFGVGLAPVVPIAFSAAGAEPAWRVGAALSWVLTIGYVGSIVGPAVIGLTAQQLGLAAALVIPVALAVLIVVLSPNVRNAPGGRR